LSEAARDGRRAARARALYAAYWLLLAVLLAFLPVLQSWEALPWSGGWTAAKLAILVLTGLLPIATRHEPRRHVAIVLMLLAAGIALLLINVGLVGR
jgi:ABC-type transport system involved in cytochrome c biogenesis permease subunit